MNCMKARKILFYVFLALSIATNVLIIVESCIGGDGSASQSFSFSQWFMEILQSIGITITDKETFRAVFRKVVGHFLLFGVSGTFTMLALCFNDFLYNKFKWINTLFCLGVGVIFAVTSELIQVYVPGRAGTFTDVFIDLGGFVLFGGLTYLIFFLIVRYHQKRIQNKNSD